MKIVTVIVPLLLLVCTTKAENVSFTCLQDLGKALKQMSASLAQLEVEMRSLKKENQVRQVAFSASLLESGRATIGPFPGFTIMIFKNVVTNIGNAYNPNTGFFTPPVKGAYHFQFYIAADLTNSQSTAAVLVKNSQNTFATFEQQASGFGTATNGITLLLNVGDVVFMQLWYNSVVYDNENHHTTFSGHLLFPM